MQPIYNIAEICARKGVRNSIVSPGSRCAPLTISFSRHPKIDVKTISDERSAAFIGLGVAQQTGKPVALICTSGSATLNYYPAIAEAFYQEVPLIVLTADRPPEWIDQNDGQTIRQNNVYSNHIKASFNLPVSYEHKDAVWELERTVSEAINTAEAYPQGPVHINVPIREPFYPSAPITFSSNAKVIEEVIGFRSLPPAILENLSTELENYNRILIVPGQSSYPFELKNSVKEFSDKTGAVIVADIISNFQKTDSVVTFHDLILSSANAEVLNKLRPDLIISFGKSIISKSLKLFLRNSNTQHWHIQEMGKVADPFQRLTKIIRQPPELFFRNVKRTKNSYYSDLWFSEQERIEKHMTVFFTSQTAFSELEVVKKVLEVIPENSVLHLSNSMPVRYANYFNTNKNIEVFSNRGTSGIDGVISTAYGAALATQKTVTVVTGDMAFFYDRNAFWNQYLPKNLRIVILNNHGGGIFKMIEGPAGQPELEDFFVTKQPLTAESLHNDFGIEYFNCKSRESLDQSLSSFYQNSNVPKILEVETSSDSNTSIFKEFKLCK